MYQSRAAAGAIRTKTHSNSSRCARIEERIEACTLELDRDVFTFRRVSDFEELPLLETKHARQDIGGK